MTPKQLAYYRNRYAQKIARKTPQTQAVAALLMWAGMVANGLESWPVNERRNRTHRTEVRHVAKYVHRYCSIIHRACGVGESVRGEGALSNPL